MLLSQKLINKRVIYLLGDHWGVTRFTLRMLVSQIMFYVAVDQTLTPRQERDRKSVSQVIHFVSTSSNCCYYLKKRFQTWFAFEFDWFVMHHHHQLLRLTRKQQSSVSPSLSIYTWCIQARYICLGQPCFSSVYSSTHNRCSYMHTTESCTPRNRVAKTLEFRTLIQYLKKTYFLIWDKYIMCDAHTASERIYFWRSRGYVGTPTVHGYLLFQIFW